MPRPIKFRAWDDNYQVCSDGRIWSNRRQKWLKTYPDKDGYPRVVFQANGERNVYRVHRLVAISFLGVPPDNKQVNHKNGIRTDNRLENLEYVTSRENTLHGWRSNGRKQSQKQRLAASKTMSELNRKRWSHA